MAGNIKGITIEFRGDTTKLDKALRQVNNETRAIDKELRNVDKALKFNPSSVELWRQKQQLLTQKISETRDKLSLLKQQQQAMDAAGVDKQSLEYQKLQREIIECQSKLKTFEGQLRSIGNVNLKAASEQFKQWGDGLENAGRKMQGLSMAAAGVVTALGALSYKAGQNADDLNTLSKVYGISTQDLQKYAAAADLVDVDVNTIAKSHLKLEKSMASAASGTGKNAEAFDKLGISVTDANGNLRSGDEVWQDTIKALGQVENETERDALAMQLMGKSAAELNPLIEDGGEAYQRLSETLSQYGLDFVDQETLDKANQFNDELDTMKAIGAVALQTVGSQLAAALAPALEKVVGLFGQFANWLSNLNPQVLAVIGVIAGVVAALAPVLIILGTLISSIGAIIGVLGMITAPMLGVVAVIAAVVAAGVLLYKNWDTIKAKALELKDNIVATWNNIKTQAVTTWNNIKTAITTPIQTAWNTVKGIIERIKGFFPLKIGKIFDGIKLPHISVNGGVAPFGIGGKGKLPSFSVNWYAHGGIFDNPSLIGVGEAGAEAVIPLDKFWDKMDKIAEGNGATYNFYITGSDPRQIAEEVRRILIQETNRRRLAWL